MVNWKKLFEEDYDEVEESSKSEKKKRSKLFEEETSEIDLDSSKIEKFSKEKQSGINRLKSVNRFEEDDLEDYYEEDDYQAALEEELREAAERAKNSRTFFKKKEAKEEVYEEDIYAEDLEEEFELEEKKDKKSGFSFFKKKEAKEDVYEEDIYAEDLEEELELEEKKDKKSGFSFFKKKETEEEVYEEDIYAEDLEEEFELEEKKDKKSGFSFFKKKETEEEVYEEDIYAEDLEEEFELEEKKDKKSGFSFFKKKEAKEDVYEEGIYEDDVYADLERELGLRETKKDKKSGFSFFKKEEAKEDVYEEDIYAEDLEEELELEEKKDKKSGFSFFKKKEAKEDVYEEDIYAEDLEEELELEEKKDKKSGFSFFKKKETEEEVYEEDIYAEDLEEEFELEEKKDKKSGFSFFKKKETEEDIYEEYDENTFTDVEEDLYDELEYEEKDKKSGFSFFKKKETEEEVYEEDIYAEDLEGELELEEKKDKKSGFSFFKKEEAKEVEYEEDLYEDSEETYDDLDLETKEEKSKKSRFSFASLKERFAGNDKDEYDYEYDYNLESEEEIQEDKTTAGEDQYEEFEQDTVEKAPVKKESCLNKVTSLFKTKDKSAGSEYEEHEEYYEEDEPEDYKTYLERQKLEAKQDQDKYDEFDLEEDYTEEDLELEKDLAPRPSGKEFFVSMKDKFTNKFKVSKEDDPEYDYDYEEEYDYDYDEEIQEEKPAKKEGFFGRFINKSDKYEDDEYEIEYVEEEPTIADKLDLVEEKEISPEEEENISLQESLRSFGIETDQIKSVDVFEERSPKEERERRVHPTLASVKVRRILQEKEIDEITYDLSMEDGKDRFANSIAKDSGEQVVEVVVKDVHESKNQEEIERLNNEFNRLNRKQDKISNSENFLRDKDGDKIEDAMNSIKSTQEEISRDTRDYTIEVEESEGAPVRRSKLSYTSLDDVLLGNEDVLDTDIERKKFDVSTSEEPHPEEIENLRKDLFKDKTSQDLVSNRERSNLDNLILETSIVEKSNEKELDEITMLEENLELLKEDKVKERARRVEDDLSAGFEEEISIEKVARESEYNFEPYEDLRHSDEYAEEEYYSDYDLDEEEIYELETQNEIEYKSDQVDIEALNRELKQKKIDEYRSQYWGVKNNSVEEKATTSPVSEAISSTSTTAAYDYARQEAMSNKFQANKPKGIEYEEKLYTNDVDEYFVTEDAPLTFGEYKTQDRGYRPVSKTTIEEKQKKLDAIFDKYSNVKIPRKNTTEYVQQKISSPVRVDKYKPTQVISAIYGTSKPAQPAETTKVAKDVKAVASAVSAPKAAKNNYFKEIASKEEQSWNLDLAPRVPKNKKSKKK